MDESAIEKKGTAPLEQEMSRIAAIKSKQEIISQVAYMHSNGVTALFSFYPMPDMHDSSLNIPNLDQGGITLPDRDYYLKDDAKSVETRQRYESTCRRCSSWRATNRRQPPPKPRRCSQLDRTGEGRYGPYGASDPKKRDHDEDHGSGCAGPELRTYSVFRR